jgi:tetratricopeptide (TPR) repeat protein
VRTREIGRRDDVTDALGAIARRAGSRRLRLDGLSRAATGQLLEALSTEPLAADMPERIHARAEGNPFYTLELARLLDEPGGVDVEVPATVSDAIRRRLGLLPRSTVDLLAVAAIVGRDVDLPTVAAIAGIEVGECVDRLDPAAECRMLVADATTASLRFSHALVREVLLDGLTPLRRAQLHLQAADTIERNGVGNDDIERLADHLWQAASLGDSARAASALERAAEIAVGRVAYTTAETQLRRAVQLRQAVGASLDAQQLLLSAQLRLLGVMQATRFFSGTDRELLHATQELATRLGLDGVSRELGWSEWASLSRRAEVSEAGKIAERYVTQWGGDPSPNVRASASIIDGVMAWSRGRFTEAIAHLDRAQSVLCEAPPPSSPLEREQPLMAETFRRYCYAAHGTMSPEEALAGFDELLDVLPSMVVDGRHQLVLALACRTAAVHARWQALGALVERALELDPAAQFAFFGGQLLLYRALVEARSGELGAALTTFVEGRARYRAVGGRTGLPLCQALLAEQLATGGRVAEAAELATGARQQVVDTGEVVDEVPVRVAEGVVALAGGDTRRAVECLSAAVAAGEQQGAHAFARRAEAVAADLGLDLTSLASSPGQR